jgi:hypothetical protein
MAVFGEMIIFFARENCFHTRGSKTGFGPIRAGGKDERIDKEKMKRKRTCTESEVYECTTDECESEDRELRVIV